MLSDWLPILMMFGLAVLFGLGSVVAGQAVGPSRPSAAKSAPYESGIVPERLPRDRFPIKFALVGMLFIIFDVEVIFFYPWALIVRELGVFGLVEMGIFVGFLLVAFVYVWRMGALDWETGISPRRAVSYQMLRAATRSPGESAVSPAPDAAAPARAAPAGVAPEREQGAAT